MTTKQVSVKRKIFIIHYVTHDNVHMSVIVQYDKTLITAM